jgi:hypothetical protein
MQPVHGWDDPIAISIHSPYQLFIGVHRCSSVAKSFSSFSSFSVVNLDSQNSG